MRKIAILGCGVVGSALKNYLSTEPKNYFKTFDPPRGLYDDVSECDIAFISVPVATLADRSQNLCHVNYCLEKLQATGEFFNKLVVIKSTILPGTCEFLAQKYLMKIVHMPEFLTERTSDKDFEKQDVICGGREILSYTEMSLIKELFWNKKIYFMRNVEAELSKYAHNAFAAVKVNFFNLIKQTSDILGADYNRVLEGVFISGYINKDHTQVPGPDSHYGYGGKCLPKDLKAFIGFLKEKGLQYSSLEQTESENEVFRTRHL